MPLALGRQTTQSFRACKKSSKANKQGNIGYEHLKTREHHKNAGKETETEFDLFDAAFVQNMKRLALVPLKCKMMFSRLHIPNIYMTQILKYLNNQYKSAGKILFQKDDGILWTTT